MHCFLRALQPLRDLMNCKTSYLAFSQELSWGSQVALSSRSGQRAFFRDHVVEIRSTPQRLIYEQNVLVHYSAHLSGNT